MGLTRLVRAGDDLKIPGIGIAEIERNLGSASVYFFRTSFPSEQELRDEIQKKARVGANAYEICGSDIKAWGFYVLSISYYKIKESAEDTQLELFQRIIPYRKINKTRSKPKKEAINLA